MCSCSLCKLCVPCNFGLLAGAVAAVGYQPESLHTEAAQVGWPELKWAQAQAVLSSHTELPGRTAEAY